MSTIMYIDGLAGNIYPSFWSLVLEFRRAELLHERNDQGLHEEGHSRQPPPSRSGEGVSQKNFLGSFLPS